MSQKGPQSEQVLFRAIEKLQAQNERLRNELQDLTKQWNETLARQKRQKRENARVPPVHQDHATDIDKEIEQEQNKLDKIKREVQNLKSLLNGNLNEREVVEKEDEVRYLQKTIKQLEDENSSLKKIDKNQKRAIDQVQNEKHYSEQNRQLQDELRNLKQQHRELTQQYKQDEKHCKEQHEKCVVLEEKCRKLKSMIKQNKNNPQQQEPEITEADIEDLRREYRQKQQQQKAEEKKLKKNVKELRARLKHLKYDNQELQVTLKQKDNELRICVVKLREVNRLIGNPLFGQEKKSANLAIRSSRKSGKKKVKRHVEQVDPCSSSEEEQMLYNNESEQKNNQTFETDIKDQSSEDPLNEPLDESIDISEPQPQQPVLKSNNVAMPQTQQPPWENAPQPARVPTPPQEEPTLFSKPMFRFR